MARIAWRARPTSLVTTSISSAVIARAMWTFLRGCERGPVVLDRHLDAHRFLARVLFGDFGGEPGDAPDDEEKADGGGRESHVVEDGREGAVDVHRQRLDP